MIVFDSLTLKFWIDENEDFISGARIQKIQQPTRRELIFSLRNCGQTKKFYVNIIPEFHHVCFMSKENETKRLIDIPAKPPMFCMLLRKYLENSKIVRVNQPKYERILEFYVETFNELSEKINLCLAIELMGKHSNIILYNYDTNMILGCAHNVGAEKSREREMAGGLPYAYPMGRPKDWYRSENSITQSDFSSINSAIDDYYAQCIYDNKLKHLKSACMQVVNSKLKKDRNSLKKMEYKLSKEIDCDKYRLFADLIMANLYSLKDYTNFADVYDYENDKNIRLQLDPTLTLKENANNFYKLYNKAKTSVNKLSELSANLKQQISYYEHISYSLDIATSVNDLFDIRAELMPEKEVRVKDKNANLPLEKEIEGCRVFVGRNNRQNDFIVSKLSKDEDYWFHTKDCAGSHVLLRCNSINDKLVYECAKLAKEYSKGKDSSKVAVIFTKRKFLKKPPGANLGYVTYKNEQEIIV